MDYKLKADVKFEKGPQSRSWSPIWNPEYREATAVINGSTRPVLREMPIEPPPWRPNMRPLNALEKKWVMYESSVERLTDYEKRRAQLSGAYALAKARQNNNCICASQCTPNGTAPFYENSWCYINSNCKDAKDTLDSRSESPSRRPSKMELL